VGVTSLIVRPVAGMRKEPKVNDVAPDQAEPRAESYEPPVVTEIGPLAQVTKGQYSRSISDDGDAGGYWEK
jgi:hypothetical protein